MLTIIDEVQRGNYGWRTRNYSVLYGGGGR